VALPLVLDADRVTSMPQHSLLYGHPTAYHRLSFLPVDEPARPLSAFAELAAWPRHDDLGADLAELVGRYLATGLDVLAVDTTSPEQRVGGFASAKVIVPGTLPMTFGHRWRRTHDIPRLASVPALLGLRGAEPGADELNPFPHPFP
jgi:ribosomal protein S12 methylthiotransferase accessory factor